MMNNVQSKLEAELQEVRMFYRHTMKKSDEAHDRLDKCQRQNFEYARILHKKQSEGKMLRKKIIEHKRQISDMRATIFGLKMKYTDLSRAHEHVKKQNQRLQTEVSTMFGASFETTPTNNGDTQQSSLSPEGNPAHSPPSTPPRSNEQEKSGQQLHETPKREVCKKNAKPPHLYNTRSHTKRSRS